MRLSKPVATTAITMGRRRRSLSHSWRRLLPVVAVWLLLLLLPRRSDGFAPSAASSLMVTSTTLWLPRRRRHDRNAAAPSLLSSSSRRRRGRFPALSRQKKSAVISPTTTALPSSASDDDENENDRKPKPLAATQDPASQQEDTTADTQEQQQAINWTRVREQLALFREMAAPYYREAPRAKRLLGTVLALTLANSGISVLFSYVGKDFWNALSARDVDTFATVLGQYVVALAVGAPVATLYKYQREQLAVHWREWMTARTFDLYVANKVYYNLQLTTPAHKSDEIDNPDQRIAEDVRTFTSFSLSLLITGLTSVIDLVAFASILWSIYPQLFVAIVLYAGLGTVITAYLGRSLVHLNFRQLRAEADLRYSLVRIRDNAESIAFYAGEDLEGQGVERRVEAAVGNRRQINAAQRNLEFFTNAYRYLVQILPVAVVAPRYFAGAVELGVISQSAGAFNHILSDLSIIVNQFEQLSTFSAGIERLSSFYEAMRAADPQRHAASPLLLKPVTVNGGNETRTMTTKETLVARTTHGSNETASSLSPALAKHDFGEIALDRWASGEAEAQSTALSIRHLDLGTPDGKRRLIRDLNLELRHGQHLLIVGPSGAGKSSLLRAIAGLWTVGGGRIGRPADEDVYFLPQRPYCTVGSLKDQLLYPSLEFNETDVLANGGGSTTTANSKPDQGNKILPRSHWLKQAMTDQDFIDVLTKVDLLDVAVRAGDGDAIKGLDVTLDWSNILSLGEQQRLAFGRLLVNRPRLVIVDEATSALDIGAEARMYSILQEMAQRQVNGKQLSSLGLTYISVGHRPSLVSFHDKKLRLGGDSAEHELSDIEKSAAQLAIGQQQQIL